jgi:lipoate-protein ligase A
MPMSLDKNPPTSAILRLLNILHELNANLDDVLAEKKRHGQAQRRASVSICEHKAYS